MKIKYVGSRGSLNTVCSGRQEYYFGPENNHTCEVLIAKHASELLSSHLHKFEVVMEDVKIEKPRVETKIEKPKEVKIEPKKRGRKKKNG